ncbi:MAG: SDR family oxidoreductase [Inquilinus sp.]|nr:SDR family oxidoreductase [Inquilinus sp.]
MDLGLKGRRALVMGASRGIGGGIARALAAEGCDLVTAARGLDKLEEAAGILRTDHAVAVEPRRLDLGDEASVAEMEVFLAGDGVDILINNGGGPPPSGALGVTPELWRRHFESMVLALIRLTDAAVGPMRQRKWGRVLTVASSGVVQPIPTLGMSNTLRSSLIAFSKTLAGEVAADGVTANVILPGRIDTERVAELDAAAAKKQGGTIDDARRGAKATIPAGRYGTVAEFASTAAFLVSAPAGYITGSVVRVDGGLIRSI